MKNSSSSGNEDIDNTQERAPGFSSRAVQEKNVEPVGRGLNHQSDNKTLPANLERRRSSGKKTTASEDRTGFARVYFESQNFTSSTVLKLFNKTTVLEVRQSMANKMKISDKELEFYVIVMVYQNDSGRSVSARTLRDHEFILQLIEKTTRSNSNISEEEMLKSLRAKPKHKSPPPLKFILKDVRSAPLDLEKEKLPLDSQQISLVNFPTVLGKGIHNGYLQKASVKDINVWRKRWFVVKDDQLLYCKSETNHRDVTAVSLLNAYLAKARPEVRVPFAFELRTPRRVYQLCANNKDDMVAWIHALHIQIGISSENHRLYEAEILITEDTVYRSEEVTFPTLNEPSLLQRVLSREETLKVFRDFLKAEEDRALLDTWIECELFRRNCLVREGLDVVSSTRATRSSKEEWDHLKSIVQAAQELNVISQYDFTELLELFESEQISRRLSIALHTTEPSDYPRVELITSIHNKLLESIEGGPFRGFLLDNGYRLMLGRIIGRIT